MQIGMKLLAVFLSITMMLTMVPATVLYATNDDIDAKDGHFNPDVGEIPNEEVPGDKENTYEDSVDFPAESSDETLSAEDEDVIVKENNDATEGDEDFPTTDESDMPETELPEMSYDDIPQDPTVEGEEKMPDESSGTDGDRVVAGDGESQTPSEDEDQEDSDANNESQEPSVGDGELGYDDDGQEPDDADQTPDESEFSESGEEDSESNSDDNLTTEDTEFLCGKEEHIHGDDCYDELGNLICSQEEHEHTDTCKTASDNLSTFISTFRLMNAERLKLVDILKDENIDTELTAVSPDGTSYKNPTSETVSVYGDEVESWQFFASLNNMAIKDHEIQEGAVYEYHLPTALIPMDDVLEEGESSPDPNNITTWRLLVNNGNAQARGCIEKTADSRYNLLIVFLPGTIEGEIDISVSYRYAATLDATKKENDKVDIPFENGGDYSVTVKERPEEPEPPKTYLSKTVEWLTNEGVETGSATSTNGDRRAKFTVTFTNPNPGQSFTGTITDTVENDSLFFLLDASTSEVKLSLDFDPSHQYYGDSSTQYYWEKETLIDGRPVTMGQFSSNSINSIDGSVKLAYGTKRSSKVLSSSPVSAYDSITVSLTNLTFDTFSYSYTVNCLDLVSQDASGTLSRLYSTTTRLESEEICEELVDPKAVREYEPVTLEGSLNYKERKNTHNGSSISSYYDQCPQYEFNATIDPNGSDWVALKLSSADDYIGLYSLLMSSSDYDGANIWKAEYSVEDKLNESEAGMRCYDPVVRLEGEDVFGSSFMELLTTYTLYFKLDDGREILMIPSADTITASKNYAPAAFSTSGSSNNTNVAPLQYVKSAYNGFGSDGFATQAMGSEGYGAPYPVTMYLFGLRGKSFDFTYHKYGLVYNKIFSAINPNSWSSTTTLGTGTWKEVIEGQNVATRSFTKLDDVTGSDIPKSFLDSSDGGLYQRMSQVGYIQEDGSIRFSSLWNFSGLKDFFDRWNNSYYDPSGSSNGFSNNKFKFYHYNSNNCSGALQLTLSAFMPQGFSLLSNSSRRLPNGDYPSYDQQGLLTSVSPFIGYDNGTGYSAVAKDESKSTVYKAIINGDISSSSMSIPGNSHLFNRGSPYTLTDILNGRVTNTNADNSFMWLMLKGKDLGRNPSTEFTSHYVLVPDDSNISSGDVKSRVFFQTWHQELQRPVAEEYFAQTARYPSLNKEISVKLNEDETNKETITSVITNSGSFTGVFNIHDDMSDSYAYTLKENSPSQKEIFKEPLAKHVKLESLKITFTEYNQNYMISFDSIKDGVNTANISMTGAVLADENPFTDSTDVTAYLTYYYGEEAKDPILGSLNLGNNMQGGFNLKIANLWQASNISVEYTCSFDASEYATASGAFGVIQTCFVNTARPNYALISNTSSNSSRVTASGFAFAAQPDASLEWVDDKDAENRQTGLYVNNYHGELDVGVGNVPEAYLALQINEVKELDSGGAIAGDVKLDEILPYLKPENLIIRASNRRWSESGGDEEWNEVYSESADVSDIYEVTIVKNPSEILKDVPVPVKDSTTGKATCQKITGNLLCLKITRKDGKPIDPNTFFDLTFDILLSKDLIDGKTFRDVTSYKGGTLGIQPQLSICYPFTAQPTGIMTIAATTDTWVSAGALVDRVDYLVWPTHTKTKSIESEINAKNYHWQMRYGAGSVGKNMPISLTLKDILKVCAAVDGNAVSEDELNKKLCDIFFKHITVNIDRILYGTPTADTKYYPGVGPNSPPSFDVHGGPVSPSTYQNASECEDAGHGWGEAELFSVTCTGLADLSEVLIDYSFVVDWTAIYKEIEESGLKLSGCKVTFPWYKNVMDYGSGRDEYDDNFDDPASILGTIKKTSEADWNKHKIVWSVDFDVKGDTVQGYRLDDTMTAGTWTGEPTENDNLAFQNMSIKSFSIYEASESEKELFNYSGPFTAGTIVKLDDSDYWTGASLVFSENMSFSLVTKTLSEGSLRIQYTTVLDEEGFIDDGGVFSDGYSVYNTAASSAPGIKISASKGESYTDPESPFTKEVSDYKDGLVSAREWRITAKTSGNLVKNIVIKDSLSANPAGLLPFLSISYMKVELISNDEASTVIYDTLKNFDNLSVNTGTLTRIGNTFELKFSTLPAGTTVVVTYRTVIDEDAYREAVKAYTSGELPNFYSENNRYTLMNSATYEQAGWSKRTALQEDDVDVPDSVTKTGTVTTPAGKDQNALVVWNVDIFLDTFVTGEQLDSIEAEDGFAVITDSLPYGLKWDETYNGNKGAEVSVLNPSGSGWTKGSKLTDEDFSAEIDPENPQKLIIKIKKPSTNRHIRVSFRTEATANLGSVKNSVSVSLNGRTKTDWSEPVDDVHTSRNGGSIVSRNMPKAVLKAVKTVNGSAPTETFIFRAEQVTYDEADGWITVTDGYDETVTSLAGGSVIFPETDYLDAGDYYFRISEIPDTSKDESAYEGAAYKWDTRAYIVHVQTLLSDEGYIVLQDVIQVLNGDADISAMDKPAFNNVTKTLREVKVIKTWNDGEDLRILRPSEITVWLYRNGSPYNTLNTYTQKLSAENGWSYTWRNLPANGVYTVKELTDFENFDYYTQGEAADSFDGNLITITLENHLKTGKLSVTKKVSGSAGEKERDWNFRITLNDTTIEGVYGDMTFAKGVAEITLKHGETKTADNLPAGTIYTVVEIDADIDRYKTSFENETGAVLPDQTVTAIFTNHRNIALNLSPPPEKGTGNLVVMKTVSDNGDILREWHFTVTLDKPLTGQYGDMYFENGVAVITLKHGESSVAKGLPEFTGYSVTEEEANLDGYITSARGEEGVISDGKTMFADFVNAKEPLFGNLEVSKIVTGFGNKGRLWHFTVTLDKPLTGQYGDMYFENGVAVITLKHGEVKTARNLPENTAFSVNETDSNEDGYLSFSTGASGIILGNETAFARFTNHLEKEHESENPKTGDWSNSSLKYYALLSGIIALICIIFIIRKAKRGV